MSTLGTSAEKHLEPSRVRHRKLQLGPHLFCATPSRRSHRLSEVQAQSAWGYVVKKRFQTVAAMRSLRDAQRRRLRTIPCASVARFGSNSGELIEALRAW